MREWHRGNFALLTEEQVVELAHKADEDIRELRETLQGIAEVELEENFVIVLW